MNRCCRCGIPNTHHRMYWLGDTCGACLNYDKRRDIDWEKRREILKQITDKARKKSGNDCIIAVSGGKDSHILVKRMTEEWGMKPLLVTVTDSFTHTKAGIHNLKNLQDGFNHWTYTMGHDLFKRASRWAFEQLGQPLKLIEYAIYLIPYYLAKVMGIDLVVFGENSNYEYGGTDEDYWCVNNYIWSLTQHMENDKEWWEKGGVKREEIESIQPHVYNWPLCIYMSHFYPWSSVDHLDIAKRMGFKTLEGEWKREGCVDTFEQIDSYGYLAHLWMRYPKMGFQRATDIATRRVRDGWLTRDEALTLIKENDHILDTKAREDFCEVLGYTRDEFYKIVRDSEWNRYFK